MMEKKSKPVFGKKFIFANADIAKMFEGKEVDAPQPHPEDARDKYLRLQNEFGEDFFDDQLTKMLKDVEILRQHGFNPIAVTTMMCEDTFVFKTQEEAERGFKEMEQEQRLVIGWWYGYRQFLKSMDDYEEQFESRPVIHWLDKSYETGNPPSIKKKKNRGKKEKK